MAPYLAAGLLALPVVAILYALRKAPRAAGRTMNQATAVVLPASLIALWWVLFEVNRRPIDASEWFVLMPLPALTIVGITDLTRRVVSPAYAMPLIIGLTLAATVAIQSGPTTWGPDQAQPWDADLGPFTIDLGVLALATSLVTAFCYAMPLLRNRSDERNLKGPIS